MSGSDGPRVSVCPDCGGKVSRKVDVCPHCGNPDPHAVDLVPASGDGPPPIPGGTSERDAKALPWAEPDDAEVAAASRVVAEENRQHARPSRSDTSVSSALLGKMLVWALAGLVLYAVPKFIGTHMMFGAIFEGRKLRALERLGVLAVWEWWHLVSAMVLFFVVPAAIFWVERRWRRDAIVRAGVVGAVGAALSLLLGSIFMGRLYFSPVYLVGALAIFLLSSMRVRHALLLALPAGYVLLAADNMSWVVPVRASAGRIAAGTMISAVLTYTPLALVGWFQVWLWRNGGRFRREDSWAAASRGAADAGPVQETREQLHERLRTENEGFAETDRFWTRVGSVAASVGWCLVGLLLYGLTRFLGLLSFHHAAPPVYSSINEVALAAGVPQFVEQGGRYLLPPSFLATTEFTHWVQGHGLGVICLFVFGPLLLPWLARRWSGNLLVQAVGVVLFGGVLSLLASETLWQPDYIEGVERVFDFSLLVAVVFVFLVCRLRWTLVFAALVPLSYLLFIAQYQSWLVGINGSFSGDAPLTLINVGLCQYPLLVTAVLLIRRRMPAGKKRKESEVAAVSSVVHYDAIAKTAVLSLLAVLVFEAVNLPVAKLLMFWLVIDVDWSGVLDLFRVYSYRSLVRDIVGTVLFLVLCPMTVHFVGRRLPRSRILALAVVSGLFAVIDAGFVLWTHSPNRLHFPVAFFAAAPAVYFLSNQSTRRMLLWLLPAAYVVLAISEVWPWHQVTGAVSWNILANLFVLVLHHGLLLLLAVLLVWRWQRMAGSETQTTPAALPGQ